MTRASAYIRAIVAELLPSPDRTAREGPFAQFGEDRILEQIFKDQPHGHCVEVGAYDGLTGSATYLFEQKGWECLLVEPNPEFADEIRRHRRCVFKNCAASSEDGEATFFVAVNVEQMSTLELTAEHQQWVRDVGGSLQEITVPKARLDTMLADAGFPRIDFMTIDVEGHELDVLRGLSLERYEPRIVIVEENSDEDGARVERYLAEHGYVNFKRTGVNEWYAREADAELVQADAIRQFHLRKAVRRSLDGLIARLSLIRRRLRELRSRRP